MGWDGPTDREPEARSSALGIWLLALTAAAILVGVWWYIERGVPQPIAAAATAASDLIAPLAESEPDEPAASAETEKSVEAPRSTASAGGGAASRPVTPPAAPVPVPVQVPVPVPVDPPAATALELPTSVVPTEEPVVPSPAPEGPPPPSAPLVTDTVVPIYGPTDADVVPPVLLTPGVVSSLLMRPRPPSSELAIEVVINREGGVVSVKATAEPRTISEALRLYNGLSIAKSWDFSPARKDGESVSYLLRVPLRILVAGRSPAGVSDPQAWR